LENKIDKLENKIDKLIQLLENKDIHTISSPKHKVNNDKVNNKVTGTTNIVDYSLDNRKIPSKNEIVCSIYKDGVLFHGQTFEIRHILKENKGFWTPHLKGWVVTKKSSRKIIKKIKISITKESINNSLENIGVKINNPQSKVNNFFQKDCCALD